MRRTCPLLLSSYNPKKSQVPRHPLVGLRALPRPLPALCAQRVPHQRVSNHHLVHHAADAKWVRWDDFEAQLDSGDDSLVAVEKGEYAPLFALLRERYPPLGDS
jgi:hypothetical protein